MKRLWEETLSDHNTRNVIFSSESYHPLFDGLSEESLEPLLSKMVNESGWRKLNSNSGNIHSQENSVLELKSNKLESTMDGKESEKLSSQNDFKFQSFTTKNDSSQRLHKPSDEIYNDFSPHSLQRRLAVSPSSEFSLFEWFNYWFKGLTLFFSTYGAISNPHKYINENSQLPDRMTHDFYSRVYKYNKQEYLDAMDNADYSIHAPMTYNYEDCMQFKRYISIVGTFCGAALGNGFSFAYNFGNITNGRQTLRFVAAGSIMGFMFSRFFLAPRKESCFEQIINQALSERIITRGYNNMMQYYESTKHEMNPEKRMPLNWYSNQLSQVQRDYLNKRMQEHYSNALKTAGCSTEFLTDMDCKDEIEWKLFLDKNFPKEYPSHRKHFKFL
ncbi:hypothetical protein C9374_011053 [Naegleria lovaniensis]|uniref:Uncharacterized protein n=1 Tax=Naegleria lovaniensis TaxID=51637 RepID=A0AA88GCY4_NAELO|nr:uncharacterized protein C9374_011053 [Naegleria lovaniensis]KAG2374216.1 hypothetical protein C9374_011053 [Naegleria lovaniensis]